MRTIAICDSISNLFNFSRLTVSVNNFKFIYAKFKSDLSILLTVVGILALNSSRTTFKLSLKKCSILSINVSTNNGTFSSFVYCSLN